MAISSQARKRARQADKRSTQNASQRSMLRTSIKKVVTAVESNDKDGALSAYKAAAPVIDAMVNKGIIHRNLADRTKSRLNVRVRSL